MNIYILRDGEKMGPFSEEAVRTLLQQGDFEEGDLACRTGASEWEPLSKVLEAALESPAPPPPPPPPEPATTEQIAFLSYFAISIPAGLQKEEAGALITKAKEDPKNAKKLALWEIEKLQLHPDLFAAELKARKEDRAQFFHDLCHTAGSDYFTGVTKAHCQVLVAFLDVKFPRWAANEADATERYFFPAVAEKFPQLVHKAWRGKFHYGHSPGAVAARASKSPTAKLVQHSVSLVGALLRGLLLGLCLLGVLYVGYVGTHGWKWDLGIPPLHTAAKPAVEQQAPDASGAK